MKETPEDLRIERTRAWRATRIEFAMGIGAVLFAAVNVQTFTRPIFGNPPMGDYLFVLTAVPYAGLLVALIGLGWMVRIYRDLRREPPSSWRYRDQNGTDAPSPPV
jgi:hypothetical protein